MRHSQYKKIASNEWEDRRPVIDWNAVRQSVNNMNLSTESFKHAPPLVTVSPTTPEEDPPSESGKLF